VIGAGIVATIGSILIEGWSPPAKIPVEYTDRAIVLPTGAWLRDLDVV
jgi:hypothetical protein